MIHSQQITVWQERLYADELHSLNAVHNSELKCVCEDELESGRKGQTAQSHHSLSIRKVKELECVCVCVYLW